MSWPSGQPPRDDPHGSNQPPGGRAHEHHEGQPPQAGQSAAPPYVAYGQTYHPYDPSYQVYGQPPPPARRTNSLAVAAIACSLLGIVTAIAAPVGAVLGHVASRQIAQTGEEGGSMAKTAIWVGWIVTGFYAIACCALFSLLLAASRAGTR